MGGSEAVLLSIVRGLRRARPSWSLELIAPGEGPLVQSVRQSGAAAGAVPLPPAIASFGERAALDGHARARPVEALRAAAAAPRYQRALGAALRDRRPDVVHTNGFKAHLFAARDRAAGAALVWHLHEYVGARTVTRALLRRYAPRCAAIVANSESVGDDARRALDGREVQVIPNGVDLGAFAPEGPRADLDALSGLAPAPPGTVRVGLVATFARWKGHEVFLRALAAIPDGAPLRAYVVGGPLYDTRGSQLSIDELTALARSIGVERRVGFTRFVASPADALRALDVVVHASTAPEPFGMVIAEAMACGRAVITSASGGAAELVRDGVDALVHAPGDAGALAAAIERLVASPGVRARLGRDARAAAESRFDAARMTGELAALYERVADRRRRA
jgi:glycosyltransferase involved in cell wall biosynthesis